jgi:hypothetical protein
MIREALARIDAAPEEAAGIRTGAFLRGYVHGSTAVIWNVAPLRTSI